MKTTIEVDLKWYYLSQNNSGGWFYRNEDVREYVLIQAISPEDAEAKAESIVGDYDAYCECCGARWSVWFTESDGEDVPAIWGTPIDEMDDDIFRHDAVLYYYDGTRRYYKFGVGFVPYADLDEED